MQSTSLISDSIPVCLIFWQIVWTVTSRTNAKQDIARWETYLEQLAYLKYTAISQTYHSVKNSQYTQRKSNRQVDLSLWNKQTDSKQLSGIYFSIST